MLVKHLQIHLLLLRKSKWAAFIYESEVQFSSSTQLVHSSWKYLFLNSVEQEKKRGFGAKDLFASIWSDFFSPSSLQCYIGRVHLTLQ